MEPSHYSYPYNYIAYQAGLTPAIYLGHKELSHQDLNFYATILYLKSNLTRFDSNPIDYLIECLKRDSSIFKNIESRPYGSHIGKIALAYDAGKIYEPLSEKLTDKTFPFQSKIFPLGSIDRHEYEYVYFDETGFEAKDDELIFDLISHGRAGWFDLDNLTIVENLPYRSAFIDSKNRIGSTSRKKFEHIQMIIKRFNNNDKNKIGLKTGLKANRKPLPKKIRMDLWERHFPNQRKGKCFACQNEIDIIAFEAGHIVSAADGGSDTVDNLLPLCQSCNRSMGKMNMKTWIAKYYPDNKLNLDTECIPDKSIDHSGNVRMDHSDFYSFLIDWCNSIRLKYPNPIELYHSRFFNVSTSNKAVKIDAKKYKSKFSYWFSSLIGSQIGPDDISYGFETKSLVGDPPTNLEPNDDFKLINKFMSCNVFTEAMNIKILPVSLVYRPDTFPKDDRTMWSYMCSKDFRFTCDVSSSVSSITLTKMYNKWLNGDYPECFRYTPSEFVIAIKKLHGWNLTYQNRNYIGLKLIS